MKTDVYCRVLQEKIDMLTKIFEAYSHLGIVSTLERGTGLVVIRGTEDTCPEIEKILITLPFKVEIVNAQNLEDIPKSEA
ncbi:MAG: DUF4911 domain-containing protein [Syntrophomonadaceae bacterium]|nr:DUF4911 domain-containing protein [Syntrophomonadaceae bacterium]